jgi:hypothetical protein
MREKHSDDSRIILCSDSKSVVLPNAQDHYHFNLSLKFLTSFLLEKHLSHNSVSNG